MRHKGEFVWLTTDGEGHLGPGSVSGVPAIMLKALVILP